MTYLPRSVMAVHSVPEWREWPAHPALRHWVLSYWQQVVHKGTRTVRILPDTCIDVTCDLSRVEAPVVYIVGPQSAPVTHEIQAPSRLFGARLHPLAATGLIGPRLNELKCGWQPLERFIGPPATELAKHIGDVDEDQAPEVFDAFFVERLIGRDTDSRLTESLGAIFATEGRVTVADLACTAGTTERTLRRMFEKQVGLTPKRFARIVRVQAALRLVEQNTGLSRIAADLGYTDQSHLIREMNGLFGDTPTAMVGRRFAPISKPEPLPRIAAQLVR